jgi:hypothetical protein
MLAFRSYRRMIQKLMEALERRDHRGHEDIESKLRDIALNDTVQYVIRHMQDAQMASTPFEVYDHVFGPQALLTGGLYCEFGVFKGTSINYMAKKTTETFHGFDSFEGLPESWFGEYGEGAFDLKGVLPKVEPNVILHKGWFNETLPPFLEKYKAPLTLLHVDCDLYSSTKTIFDLMKDRIVNGTIIIFDEYFNFPFWQNHEFKAFKEFIAETGLKYDYLCYNKFHQQVAVKIRSN